MKYDKFSCITTLGRCRILSRAETSDNHMNNLVNTHLPVIRLPHLLGFGNQVKDAA